MKQALAVLAALALAALLLTPAAAIGKVRSCGQGMEYVDGGKAATITTARNMTCRQALNDLLATKDMSARRTHGGFRCRVVKAPTDYRCKRGVRAYRFSYFE